MKVKGTLPPFTAGLLLSVAQELPGKRNNIKETYRKNRSQRIKKAGRKKCGQTDKLREDRENEIDTRIIWCPTLLRRGNVLREKLSNSVGCTGVPISHHRESHVADFGWHRTYLRDLIFWIIHCNAYTHNIKHRNEPCAYIYEAEQEQNKSQQMLTRPKMK